MALRRLGMVRPARRAFGPAAVTCLAVLVVALGSISAQPQTPPAAVEAAGGELDLDRLIERYFDSRQEYLRTFLNLVAEETKVVEAFGSLGERTRRRRIVSDLLVYRVVRDGTEAATEYRDARSVDGRAVEKRGERAVQLLANASKAGSLEEALETINRETERYEFGLHLRGFTIAQYGLPEQWRETFRVELVRRELMAGREVALLDYRQIAPAPGPGSTLPLPKELGNTPLFAQGRMWVDVETGQLRRSVWELAARHPAAREPLVMIHAEYVYTPSRFEIPVPERIVVESRRRFDHPKNGVPSLELTERTTFTYGDFKRFEVTTDVTIPEAPVR